jgi:uncharacterized Fe-S center protein
LASRDILALEKATVDLLTEEEDVFYKAQQHNVSPHQLKYAAGLSLGSLNYELVKL